MKTLATAVALAALMGVAGCSGTTETIQHGYQLNEETLALVPEGSTREQALLSLGTPSTSTRLPNGNEALYYISQTKQRPVAFMTPRVTDQRVLAVYLDDSNTVDRIANYGLKDGKVFDYIGRVTPTGGREISFVGQLLGAAGSVANPLGSAQSGPEDGF